MTIDLTGTDDAAAGPVNCGEAQAISACRVAYKLLVAPNLPTNGGSFAPLVGARCAAARSSARSRALAVRVVLQPARAADRPGRQGAQPGAAAEGGRRELRRLDDRRLRRARPAHRARLLPHRADGRRLGRLGGLGRRERADQQRQRRHEGLPDRDPRDAHPAARPPVRLPRPTRAAPASGAAATASCASSRSSATRPTSPSGGSARRRPRGASSAAATRRRRTSSINPGRDDERHILKATRLVLKRGDVIRGDERRRRRLRRSRRARPRARARPTSATGSSPATAARPSRSAAR